MNHGSSLLDHRFISGIKCKQAFATILATSRLQTQLQQGYENRPVNHFAVSKNEIVTIRDHRALKK